MKIEILNVTEPEFKFEESAIPEKKSAIGVELRPVLMYRATSDVVGLQVSIRFVNRTTGHDILNYGVLTTYRIDKSELFAKGTSKADLINAPLMLKLLEFTVGMLRGALAIKTKGTKMESAILPYFEMEEFAKTLVIEKVDTQE